MSKVNSKVPQRRVLSPRGLFGLSALFYLMLLGIFFSPPTTHQFRPHLLSGWWWVGRIFAIGWKIGSHRLFPIFSKMTSYVGTQTRVESSKAERSSDCANQSILFCSGCVKPFCAVFLLLQCSRTSFSPLGSRGSLTQRSRVAAGQFWG